MKKEYNRNLGNWNVELNVYTGKIVASWKDEYYNFGTIYFHNLERWQDYIEAGLDINHCLAPQVIGMDSELTPRVKKYIYDILIKIEVG